MASLAIALLQIDSILNDVYCRTTTVAAFVMAGGGFILTTMFLTMIPQLSSRKGRTFWIEVSCKYAHLLYINVLEHAID